MTQHSIHIFLATIYSSVDNIWASCALQGIMFKKTAWFAGPQSKQKVISVTSQAYQNTASKQ